MPMMRCACLLACSRASSSMRLTMWAASIRASSSITRTSSSRACWAVRPAICSSLARSSSTMRSSSASRFSSALLAGRPGCGRAGEHSFSRLASSSRPLVEVVFLLGEAALQGFELAAALARGRLELGAGLEELLLGGDLGLAHAGLALALGVLDDLLGLAAGLVQHAPAFLADASHQTRKDGDRGEEDRPRPG